MTDKSLGSFRTFCEKIALERTRRKEDQKQW